MIYPLKRGEIVLPRVLGFLSFKNSRLAEIPLRESSFRLFLREKKKKKEKKRKRKRKKKKKKNFI